MQVLKFCDFLVESKSTLAPGIEKYMDQGYVLKARKRDKSTNGDFLIFDDNNPHSYCFYFLDTEGQEKNKIWIPKDQIEVKGEGEERIFEIHPEKKWISKFSNRDSLEDFIEDFSEYQIDTKNNSDASLQEVKDDVLFLLDCLGLDGKITSITAKDNNSHELSVHGIGKIELYRGNPRSFYSEIKFFPEGQVLDPSIIITSKKGFPEFECFPQNGLSKSFSCHLDEVPAHPYYNFLFKKSLGKDSHEDVENLLEYFLENLPKEGFSTSDSTKKENELRLFLKEIKSILSTFLPEEKLASLSPSKV